MHECALSFAFMDDSLPIHCFQETGSGPAVMLPAANTADTTGALVATTSPCVNLLDLPEWSLVPPGEFRSLSTAWDHRPSEMADMYDKVKKAEASKGLRLKNKEAKQQASREALVRGKGWEAFFC